MASKATFLAACMVAVIGLSLTDEALAHDAGSPSQNSYCPWHFGGQMGPGMMGPGMMGQGMMGQGMGPGHGMMGPGYGMMGQGYGMTSQGMGPGMMAPLREDLSAADVRHMMEHRLAWNGNPNVKVGNVEETDADTIVAEIVTQDGSLVQTLAVDRHTGWTLPAQ